MSVVLVNTAGNQRVQGGDKFRVTWTWLLSPLLPGNWWDAQGIERQMRDYLPGMGLGFVPVSPLQAVPGDKVIVFDVRLSQQWSTGARTVADVVRALDQIPSPTVDAAVNVTRVERLALSLSSADLAAGQTGAVGAGNAAPTWGDSLVSGLKKFTVGTVVVAALALGGYWYFVKRKG